MKRLNSNIIIYSLVSLSVLIFISNIFNYDPRNGYDGDAHYEYIKFVSMYLPNEFKLPTSQDTYEFFSPPLAYIVPSLVGVGCRMIIESSDFERDCYIYQENITQLTQVIMYILLIIIFIQIAKLLFPYDKKFRNTLLIFLILMLPNYRAFMMFRGEPYVVLFILIMTLYLLLIYKNKIKLNFLNSLVFGLLIGLVALSRQWGFLFFPSVAYFLFITRRKLNTKKLFLFFCFSSLIGFLISGWFYLGLYNTYGSFAKFNLEPNEISLINFIKVMTLNSNVQEIFTNPTRTASLNGLYPIFYSDLWGDYSAYFTYLDYKFSGRDLNIENYLGRVNLVSIYPTLLVLFGFLYFFVKSLVKKRKDSIVSVFESFFVFNLFTTWIFYCFWISIYSFREGIVDGISAVYMLQIVNILPFIAALFCKRIYDYYPKFYRVNIGILSLIFLHNINVIYL